MSVRYSGKMVNDEYESVDLICDICNKNISNNNSEGELIVVNDNRKLVSFCSIKCNKEWISREDFIRLSVQAVSSNAELRQRLIYDLGLNR